MSDTPRIRKISECTTCGIRTMCVSDDGGIEWACNRCKIAYGVGREKLYDDPALQKKVEHAKSAFSDDDELYKQPAKTEQKDEVKQDDQSKQRRKKTN